MSMIGTPYYVSPELVNEEKYSYKSDVWAIGCVLYELCYLKRAYDGKNIYEIAKKICKDKPSFNHFKYSKELLKLIKALLKRN